MKKGDLVIWKSSAYYGDYRPDELAIVVWDGGKSLVNIMSVYDLEEHWVGREYIHQAKQLAWMVNCIAREGFGEKYLDALVKIVGLFNDCEDSEREIFEFADKFYERYGK